MNRRVGCRKAIEDSLLSILEERDTGLTVRNSVLMFVKVSRIPCGARKMIRFCRDPKTGRLPWDGATLKVVETKSKAEDDVFVEQVTAWTWPYLRCSNL